MPKPKKKTVESKNWPKYALTRTGSFVAKVWRKNLWNKIWLCFMALIIFFTGGAYGIAQWYIFSQRHQPLQLGVTFIPGYAQYLGVDPHETLQAIIQDLHPSTLRLVSYWDDIEKTPGVYDFSTLDWQMQMAEKAGIHVSLSIGLRQPRWPECHMPTWEADQPKDVWYPKLKQVMQATVERYRSSIVLDSWQLENEYFLKVFGNCPDFSRDRLVEEFNLMKQWDPNHTIIISRSNNAIGFPIYAPTPDEYGVSVYKRVWDRTITHRYVEYPFPAWFYAFLAGGGKLLTGKDMVIHELQAEAWTPASDDIRTAPVNELYKSMDAKRLQDRFQYGEATGIHHIDLWGVEWWYAMKVIKGDPSLWNTAVNEFDQQQ